MKTTNLRNRTVGWTLAGVVLVGALSACGGASSADPPSKGDAQAKIACNDFRGLIQDVNNGVVNDAEIRSQIKHIYGNAKLSDTPHIAKRAGKMLADATNGGPLTKDTKRMARSCMGIVLPD